MDNASRDFVAPGRGKAGRGRMRTPLRLPVGLVAAKVRRWSGVAGIDSSMCNDGGCGVGQFQGFRPPVRGLQPMSMRALIALAELFRALPRVGRTPLVLSVFLRCRTPRDHSSCCQVVTLRRMCCRPLLSTGDAREHWMRQGALEPAYQCTSCCV